MDIKQINTAKAVNNPAPLKKQEVSKQQEAQTRQGYKQLSSKTSAANMAYGLAQVSFGGVQKVSDKASKGSDCVKTLNLFYFSDTHGELTGLTKLSSAKEAAEEFCGGEGKLTVLGSGDLIAGSQSNVIHATVDVVNKMGMEATAMGNHERSRSDAKLQALADDLNPEILAINASKKDKECSVGSAMVLKQGENEFIAIGATPLTPVQKAEDIATAIDKQVSDIRENRKANGQNPDIPVVLLSHMGSFADKTVAENSETVNLILGGHTHNVEEFDYKSKNGQEVKVLQAGANNKYATVVKMNISPDGKVSCDAQMIDLKQDNAGMCAQLESFYGKPDLADEAMAAAKVGEEFAAKTVAESVGPKIDVAYVPEGQGYINDGTERNYSNPVSNIMADAMIAATADKGVQVSFFNAPSLKDTSIPDMQNITNYDIMGRMLPFGGEVTVTELPISKLYEIIEERAQSVVTMESQLIQCGGMSYSVDANKAKARYDASIGIMQAEDDLKKAKENGGDVTKAEADLAQAQAYYDELPQCVEKILILNPDKSELKINPKAIARGDFDGITITCASNDFLAHQTGIDTEEYGYQKTGKELTKVFEQELGEVRKYNEDVMHVDHNDVRISIKDKEGIVNGYPIPTGINTKYWY